MAIINNVNEVLHRLRVKLYPNYLPNIECAYIARTDSEASLNIEQVCAALKNRGGCIDEFIDAEEDSINAHYLPGNQFIIHGHRAVSGARHGRVSGSDMAVSGGQTWPCQGSDIDWNVGSGID